MKEVTRIEQAASALRSSFGEAPSGAVLLGSGGGPMVSRWSAVGEAVPYAALGLPATTVPGHAGQVQLMEAAGHRLLVLSGRVHAYEGHDNATMTRTLRALRHWGVERIILTSAVGSLRRDLPPGSLVRITDHINFAHNPLIGNPAPGASTRFPDMGSAYSPALGRLFSAVAAEQSVALSEGIYAMMSGPSYETPAEVRMLGMLGADVVGMSMPIEVVAAAEIGMAVLGISVVSNFGAGLSDEHLTHDEVLEVVGGAVARLGTVIEGVLARW